MSDRDIELSFFALVTVNPYQIKKQLNLLHEKDAADFISDLISTKVVADLVTENIKRNDGLI